MADKIGIEDFKEDSAWAYTPAAAAAIPDLIEGVIVTPLSRRADHRGHLIELITDRDGPIEPVVHVYQVYAAPGSVRAWVYHKRQHDRLHYTEGRFRLVMFDIRKDSGTYGKVNVLDLGEANPAQVVIPPFVVHGLKNLGTEMASFVNMPTRAYDPARPDKWRLPPDHSGVPYSFD